MSAPNSQLILDFEPGPSFPERSVRLQMFRDQREYFDAKRNQAPAFDVSLPRPIHETALMDPGGWRRRPPRAYDAQSLGARMWSDLPDIVRSAILAGSSDEPQRVAVLSTGTGMDDIPWEWLNAGPESPIAAIDSVRFMRLVPALYAPPPLTVALPIRVLIVLTSPKDERMLQPNVEVNVVRQGLRNGEAYEVRELLEPRFDALRTALEWSPHIIHYIGHAAISGNTGNLILHDEKEGSRWFPPAEIAQLIPASVRLLCLSTCVTAENYEIKGLEKVAHCPAELSLPTSIVNQYAIGQTAAEAFWAKFYPALTEADGSVVEAFHQARIAVRAGLLNPNTWDWASFSLVVRDGSGHPLRIATSTDQSPTRFATELQAQWTARLANNLATRMRSLDSNLQKHWEKTLGDEASRIINFESDIANMRTVNGNKGELRAALAEIAKVASAPVATNEDAQNIPGPSDQALQNGLCICTPKTLPARLLVDAAKTAVRINPLNAPMSQAFAQTPPGFEVMEPQRIAVLTVKYWGPTPRQLTVSFMENTPADLRARIVSHMNAWTETACISFVETSGTGDVRISRGPGGYYSYLGSDILHIPKNRQTMNLEGFTMVTPESEYKRVVRHETGHTLGCVHEHMRKELVALVDPQKAYAYFLQTQGWNKATVDAQVLTPLDEASLMSTPPDQTSIMCYQLPGLITITGQPILGGVDINPTDYQFIGKIYPKTGLAPQQGLAGPDRFIATAMTRSEEGWPQSEDVKVEV